MMGSMRSPPPPTCRVAATIRARGPMQSRRRARGQLGVTLVELVIAIVVIGIAVTGVLLAYTQTVLRSADPMIVSQGVAIAEAYLDEILAKPVNGPAGATRATYGRVADYNGLVDNPPEDQTGTPIPELAAYTVSVVVGGGDDLGIGAQEVEVTVAHATGSIVVRGHKADY